MDRPDPGPHLGLPDQGPLAGTGRRGGPGRDQRLGRRREAAVVLHPAQGRRLDRVRLLDLLRGPRRRGEPGRPAQARAASRTGSRTSGAGPGRPTGGCSTTGPRPTRTASRGASARRWSGGTRTPASGPGTTSRTSSPTGRRPTGPPEGATGVAAISGIDPFIMQADGKAWLFAPGRPGGRAAARALRAAGIPAAATCCTASSTTRSGRSSAHPRTGTSPAATEPGSDVFPYVATTYRLTEHHTAGGMSPLAALPGRAAAGVLLRGLTRAGRRAGPGAHGLGDDHHRPQRHRGPGDGHPADDAADRAGRRLHQVGLPWHWGPNGLTTGDARQRAVAPVPGPERAHPGGQGAGRGHPAGPAAARPGPARAGPFLPERAGITDETGTEAVRMSMHGIAPA